MDSCDYQSQSWSPSIMIIMGLGRTLAAMVREMGLLGSPIQPTQCNIWPYCWCEHHNMIFLKATQCLLLYFWKMPLASFSGAKSPHTGDIFPRQSRKKTQKLTFLRFNFWKHWKSKKSLHSRNRSILLTVRELMTAFVMDLLPHRDYSQNNCYETNRPCFRQLHGGGDAKNPLKDRCRWVALI